MHPTNDLQALGYAIASLEVAHYKLNRLQDEFPNFAVPLEQIKLPFRNKTHVRN